MDSRSNVLHAAFVADGVHLEADISSNMWTRMQRCGRACTSDRESLQRSPSRWTAQRPRSLKALKARAVVMSFRVSVVSPTQSSTCCVMSEGKGSVTHEGQSVVVMRLHVPVPETFAKLDLLMVSERYGVVEGIEGQGLTVCAFMSPYPTPLQSSTCSW